MTQATTLRVPTVARDRHGPAAFAAGRCERASWPADADYAEACRIWNGMIERRPALVVRPRDSGDVIACVGFARDSGVPLSVRSAGHHIAGTALCADGVMIDFSTHKAVEVDAGSRRVKVQPGATWADLGQAEFTATPTSHVYRSKGEHTARLDVTYVAEYRFDGSAWRWIDGTLTIEGAPQRVLVGEFDTVLVSGPCTTHPDSPGCG